MNLIRKHFSLLLIIWIVAPATAPQGAIPPTIVIHKGTNSVAKVDMTLGERISLRVYGLGAAMDKSGLTPSELVLYLGGQPIPLVWPIVERGSEIDTLSFTLRSTKEAANAWLELASAAQENRRLQIAIGDANGPITRTDNVDLYIPIRNRFGFLAFLVLSLALLLLLWKSSELLRDPRPLGLPASERKVRAPFSLSKTQLALWSLSILVLYIYIWSVTGSSQDIINSTVSTILLISSGTTGAMLAWNKKLRPPELQAAEKKALRQAGHIDTEISDTIKSYDTKTEGFLKDYLTGAEGASVHRIQYAIWNLVLLGIFIAETVENLAFPTFDNATMSLLLVSSGTNLFMTGSEGHNSNMKEVA